MENEEGAKIREDKAQRRREHDMMTWQEKVVRGKKKRKVSEIKEKPAKKKKLERLVGWGEIMEDDGTSARESNIQDWLLQVEPNMEFSFGTGNVFEKSEPSQKLKQLELSFGGRGNVSQEEERKEDVPKAEVEPR